jgi:hypothetical protein
MAQTNVNLSLADRVLINRVLSNVKKVSLETTRTIREVHQVFELRAADKERERLANERQLDRDFQAKTAEKIEDLAERKRAEAEIPAPFSWADLDVCAQTYALDDVHLKWLRREVESADWQHVRQWHPQTGEWTKVEIPVTVDMMVAIANLGDALAAAKAG